MYVRLVDKKFCFFIDLRTCCFVIAYLLLFTQTSGLLFALFLCSNNDQISEMLAAKREGEEFWANLITLVIVAGIILVLAVTVVVFTVLLIIGLHKENRKLIKMYLVFSTIMLVISATFCFISEFVFVMHPTTAHFRVLSVVTGILFPSGADPLEHLTIATAELPPDKDILSYGIYTNLRRTLVQAIHASFIYIFRTYWLNMDVYVEKKSEQNA